MLKAFAPDSFIALAAEMSMRILPVDLFGRQLPPRHASVMNIHLADLTVFDHRLTIIINYMLFYAAFTPVFLPFFEADLLYRLTLPVYPLFLFFVLEGRAAPLRSVSP